MSDKLVGPVIATAVPTSRVSLVLGSGGARGYAHIGVIEELLVQGFRIESIAGSSMGALVGGVYAADKLDQYRNWVGSMQKYEQLNLEVPSRSMSCWCFPDRPRTFSAMRRLARNPLPDSPR